MKRLFYITTLILLTTTFVFAQVRIKDLTTVQGMGVRQYVGYGLVTGLNGTGDTRRTRFTTQSVVNMLQRFGINVSSINQRQLRLRNVAAVMVTAEVPAFAQKGDRFTVTISSMGDAKSLEGGVLLMTPLVDAAGNLVAMAQGPITVGGFSIQTTGGGGVRQNHTLVGKIPGGAVMKVDLGGHFQLDSTIALSVKEKDLTTTQRIVAAINQRFTDSTAVQSGPYSVTIRIPPELQSSTEKFAFLSEIQQLEVEPDVPARVVINERTGTVVIGGNVRLLPASVAHGNLSVEIKSNPIVSQPPPFSQGQTVVVPNTQATVYQDTGKLVTLNGAATVQQVTQALNSLGVMPRDIIAILQALKEAGALQAEIVVM